MLLISFCDFISSANSWFLLFLLFLRDFKNKKFRAFCDFRVTLLLHSKCNFDFSLFTIHFSLIKRHDTRNEKQVVGHHQCDSHHADRPSVGLRAGMIEKVSAALLLLFGAVVALISLFMPPEGEIDGSVLMLFAQILVYAGSIFGVKIYIKDLIKRANK